jgi:hypothetical protein
MWRGDPTDPVRFSARAHGAREIRTDPDEHAPPGWVYNPSSWRERLPIVYLAVVGFAVAGWIGLFQMGALRDVPEPFFGDGSRRIFTSDVSRVLPVPDGVLGALSYLADAVFGLVGGTARWRRHPWVVILFGILVVPFGLITLLLFLLQPTLFGAWATFALVSTALSLAMVPYAWDEVVASWLWLQGRLDAGVGLWPALLGR